MLIGHMTSSNVVVTIQDLTTNTSNVVVIATVAASAVVIGITILLVGMIICLLVAIKIQRSKIQNITVL